jgi:hypothetical protein
MPGSTLRHSLAGILIGCLTQGSVAVVAAGDTLAATAPGGADSVIFRGIPYSFLGDATLTLDGTPESGTLTVDNIGLSGLDGLSAELPDACFHAAFWEPLPASDDGDLLRLRIRGQAFASPDTLLGKLVFQDTGPDLELSVDLLPSGGIVSQIRVKDGSTVLYNGLIADTGVVAHVGGWPTEFSLESACSDAYYTSITFQWDTPTTVSIPDGPTVSARSIEIVSMAFFATFSRLEMEAAGIPSMTILDAGVRLVGGGAEDNAVPSRLSLAAGVPNPFNPQTEIRFSLAGAAPVLLTVHDARGSLVKTLLRQEETAGTHAVTWDGTDEAGRDLGSGTYIVRLESGTDARSRKVTLVR